MSRQLWAPDNGTKLAARIIAAASAYWLATLVGNYAVFTLTDALADHPGDGAYTTKAIMSLVRGVGMPFGFALALVGPVRRLASKVDGWARPATLVGAGLAIAVLPNAGFTLAPEADIVISCITRFVGSACFSLAFCSYVSYVQGRRVSDTIMTSVTVCMMLSAPLSRVIAPSVERWLRIGDRTMPMAVGLVVAPVLLAGAAGLCTVPEPDATDRATRMPRHDTTPRSNRRWLARHWPLLAGLAVNNMVNQGVRAVRDLFATDLLGLDAPWWQWVIADVPMCIVASGAYAVVARTMPETAHRRMVTLVHVVGAVSGVVLAVAGWMGVAGLVDPLAFLVLSGVGYFVAVVPFAGGGLVFERLIAASREPMDAVLLNVISQCVGYVGSLGVLLLAPAAANVGAYFYWSCLIGGVALAASYACALLAIPLSLPPDNNGNDSDIKGHIRYTEPPLKDGLDDPLFTGSRSLTNYGTAATLV